MNRSFRATLSLVVAALPLAVPTAHAEGAGKCQFGLIAKLPVVMERSRASVPVTVNGTATRVWLDSGAFFNFMPKARAVELGLSTQPLPQGFHLSGIGGTVTPELAQVRDFGIIGVTMHNVQFLVGGTDAGNGFLGSNLLGTGTTEFDLAKGVVNLFQERGCGGVSLAYWGKGMSVGEARVFNPVNEYDHHIIVEVLVNGQSLHALLDTGAPTSTLGRRAAERAGIDLGAPDVVASVRIGGIGAKRRQSWIARTRTISIGGENITNSPIRVIDDSDDVRSADMVLGVDFLLSHHVIVSRAQKTMFLTYNGGPIFSATTDHEIGKLDTRAEGMGASEQSAEPKTADEFAGRASGRMDRNDVAGAIADFGEAIRLAPTRADLLQHRAEAYLRSGKVALARQDLDAALAIQPDDHRLLTRRAQLRLATGDRAGRGPTPMLRPRTCRAARSTSCRWSRSMSGWAWPIADYR
jgi:predicted aspartyl protease